jgi:nucleotide-binding universal stress UspA family protein
MPYGGLIVARRHSMYRQIVVGTDGSDGAGIAVDAAIRLAGLTGATLHVVNAHRAASPHKSAAGQAGVPTAEFVAPDDVIRSEAQRICDETAERAGQAGVTVRTHCVAADAADAILQVAEETGADLILVGNRGMSGPRRFVLGSVPNRLSHHCASSLLIVDTTAARA